jgi:Peptidase M50B-like
MDNSVSLSGMANEDINELTAYHEAGHAIMARLFGRRVHSIRLDLNVEGTYNGRTDWGIDDISRVWDQNIPYDELGLKQAESNNAVVLVIAAGKASETLWFRQRGLDEAIASFGSRGQFNDELELEREILARYRGVKPDEISLGKQAVVELAMKLLGSKVCWQVLEPV